MIQYPVMTQFSSHDFSPKPQVAYKIAFLKNLPADPQGLPGQDGPPGPRGVAGCNGTKVSLKK